MPVHGDVADLPGVDGVSLESLHSQPETVCTLRRLPVNDDVTAAAEQIDARVVFSGREIPQQHPRGGAREIHRVPVGHTITGRPIPDPGVHPRVIEPTSQDNQPAASGVCPARTVGRGACIDRGIWL